MKVFIPQWCQTLCNPMDCGPPDFSVHGIFQARLLEWVAISFSRGSYWTRDQTQDSGIGRWILYCLSHQGSPRPKTHPTLPPWSTLLPQGKARNSPFPGTLEPVSIPRLVSQRRSAPSFRRNLLFGSQTLQKQKPGNPAAGSGFCHGKEMRHRDREVNRKDTVSERENPKFKPPNLVRSVCGSTQHSIALHVWDWQFFKTKRGEPFTREDSGPPLTVFVQQSGRIESTFSRQPSSSFTDCPLCQFNLLDNVN